MFVTVMKMPMQKQLTLHTLTRSSGCVKHAAHALDTPPKYQRGFLFDGSTVAGLAIYILKINNWLVTRNIATLRRKFTRYFFGNAQATSEGTNW